MRIPTHQIHNVLDAYARRLKTLHDAGAGHAGESPDDRIISGSADAKRRWIIDKISTDIIHRIIRSGPLFQPDPSNAESEPETLAPSPKNPPAESIDYHVLTPDGHKITKTITLQDSEFLIRQIDDIARNSRE